MIDDRQAQFLVLVGNACNDARLGALPVEVTLVDGGQVVGVPDPEPSQRACGDGDDTGWAEDLRVDDTVVRLCDIAEIRVRRP